MSVRDEAIRKVAATVMGDRKGKITAGGIFISGNNAEEGKARTERARALIGETGSVNRAVEALKKEYPNAFVTSAFKQEKAPGGIVHGFKRLLRMKSAKSADASYADRSGKPRVFIRSGPSGGYHQSTLYREVARGLYDNELNQPHVKKRDRVVYV